MAACLCNNFNQYYILKQKKNNSINRQSPCFSSTLQCSVQRQTFANYNTKTGQQKGSNLAASRQQEDGDVIIPGTGEESSKGDELSRATLIWRAIKLPMYSVAFIPLTVGTAAAYFHTGKFYANRYFSLLLSSFLIVAWVNLCNDVYDFDTGVDKNKKESVVNLFGSRIGTYALSFIALVLSAMGLITVALDVRSPYPVLLSSYAVICGYIYQCPPFRLEYLGLGEPLCFAAFWPFAIITFNMLQSNTRGVSIIGAVVASSILVEDDRAAGKLSPLVRIGTKTGAKVVQLGVATLYSLVYLSLDSVKPFLSRARGMMNFALNLAVPSSCLAIIDLNLSAPLSYLSISRC